MPCIKRPQTARCPLQAESERNAGLLINGECAQYGSERRKGSPAIFAGQAFNASNHFTGPVREPPRFTDVRPLANLRESAAALETGITRPAFRHGSAPGEGAPMPSNEEKESPNL